MRAIDAETLKNRILQIYPIDIGGEAVQKAVIRIVNDAPTINGWITTWDDKRKKYITYWMPPDEPPEGDT